jgi:hypothetical protein
MRARVWAQKSGGGAAATTTTSSAAAATTTHAASSHSEFRLRQQHLHAPAPVLPTARAAVEKAARELSARFLRLQDSDDAAAAALDHLQAHAASARTGRAVYAVFDIDDTLFRYTDPNDDYCEDTVCVASARAMYDACIKLGVRVVLVTARANTPTIATTTRAQLAERGYRGYDALALRPPSVSTSARDVATFKATARARFAPALVLNVGDQFTDLLGGLSDDEYARVYDERDPRAHYAITLERAPSTLHIKLPHRA